ncbi:hypothetical protein D3C72_2455390 [compost metagenome]
MQAPARGCQRQAATLAQEQRRTERLLQRPQMAADCAVGDVQFVGRAADAVQPGDCLERAQGIERGQVAAH